MRMGGSGSALSYGKNSAGLQSVHTVCIALTWKRNQCRARSSFFFPFFVHPSLFYFFFLFTIFGCRCVGKFFNFNCTLRVVVPKLKQSISAGPPTYTARPLRVKGSRGLGGGLGEGGRRTHKVCAARVCIPGAPFYENSWQHLVAAATGMPAMFWLSTMQAELPKSVPLSRVERTPPHQPQSCWGSAPVSVRGHVKFSNHDPGELAGRRSFAQITIKNCFKWFTNHSTHTTPQRTGVNRAQMVARNGSEVI